MASLKESTSKFESLKVQLLADIEETDKKLQDCDSGINSGDDPLAQLTQLKDIETHIEVQLGKVRELKSLGENLLSTLEALDCRDTPKGKQIQMSMESIPARLHELRDSIVMKLQNQDKSSLTALLEWVKKKQEGFESSEPVSLDRDLLNKQIQAHRALMSEIEKYHSQVPNLICHYESDALCLEQTRDLQKQFSLLLEKVRERQSTLEDVVKKLESFHLATYQLKSWFAYAKHSMKQESVDLEFLFSKVESLYSQKLDKEEHLESVKTIGNDLLHDENCGDKDQVNDLLNEIQQKWADVQQELIQLTSNVVQRRMECYGKYLEKVSKECSASEVINADPEKVTKQYADQQVAHAAIKKRHCVENEFIDKYKTIYKALTSHDPMEIQSSWISLQKQYTSIMKHSESHMAELQEALPAQLSADIEADEILQEWIEVDSLDGKKQKIQEMAAGEKDRDTPESHDKDQSTEQPSSSPALDRKRDKSPNVSSKEGSPEHQDRKSEKKTRAKKHDSVSSIFDSELTGGKKAKQKEDTKHSDNKKEENKVKKQKTSSKKSSSPSKRVDDQSEKWGPADIDLGRDTKGSRYKFFDYGIVILNCKDSVRMTEIRKFVNQVTKAGFIKFYREKQKVIKIAVFLNHQRDVNKCVIHLNNKLLGGRRVTVLKARIHRGDLERPRSHSKSSKSKHGDSPSHRKYSVMKDDSFKEFKKDRDSESSSRLGPPRMWFKPRHVRKIISLTELRATKPFPRLDQDKRRFHIIDMKQRRLFRPPHLPFRPKPFSPEIDLEVERRKLMIERQALERERLQAERERIALERERQRRQLEEMYNAGGQRRGHKRNADTHRDDGSYWSEPKRPMYDRFREEHRFPVDNDVRTGRFGMGRLPERYPAENRHSFDDVHHMERNNFRSGGLNSAPSSSYSKPPFLPKSEMPPRSNMKVGYCPESKSWPAPAMMRDNLRKTGNRRSLPHYEGRHYKDTRHDRPLGRFGNPVNKPMSDIRMPSPRTHLPYGNPVRKSTMGGMWK